MKYKVICYMLTYLLIMQSMALAHQDEAAEKNVFSILRDYFVQAYSKENPFNSIACNFELLDKRSTDGNSDEFSSKFLHDATICAERLIHTYENDSTFIVDDLVHLHSLYKQALFRDNVNINEIGFWNNLGVNSWFKNGNVQFGLDIAKGFIGGIIIIIIERAIRRFFVSGIKEKVEKFEKELEGYKKFYSIESIKNYKSCEDRVQAINSEGKENKNYKRNLSNAENKLKELNNLENNLEIFKNIPTDVVTPIKNSLKAISSIEEKLIKLIKDIDPTRKDPLLKKKSSLRVAYKATKAKLEEKNKIELSEKEKKIFGIC